MKENLSRSKGVIFSEGILLELVKKGLSREEAYKIVQDSAVKSFKYGQDFKQVIKTDSRITKYLSNREIEKCFELKSYLKNIDKIFHRVFS